MPPSKHIPSHAYTHTSCTNYRPGVYGPVTLWNWARQQETSTQGQHCAILSPKCLTHSLPSSLNLALLPFLPPPQPRPLMLLSYCHFVQSSPQTRCVFTSQGHKELLSQLFICILQCLALLLVFLQIHGTFKMEIVAQVPGRILGGLTTQCLFHVQDFHRVNWRVV